MFPCQTNSFAYKDGGLEADIRLRIEDDNGGFYPSQLTETLVPVEGEDGR